MPRTYLVDTNIFLEVMLSQSRSEECKRILTMLRQGKAEGVVTDFTVHSIMVLMDRLKRLEKLRVFLSSLTAYKGLCVYTTSISDELRAAELAGECELDIDDAIQYAAALSTQAAAIISFDKDLDDLKVSRREPAQIVEDAETKPDQA